MNESLKMRLAEQIVNATTMDEVKLIEKKMRLLGLKTIFDSQSDSHSDSHSDSQEVSTKIVELATNGVSQRDIAESVGVSLGKVQRVLKKEEPQQQQQPQPQPQQPPVRQVPVTNQESHQVVPKPRIVVPPAPKPQEAVKQEPPEIRDLLPNLREKEYGHTLLDINVDPYSPEFATAVARALRDYLPEDVMEQLKQWNIDIDKLMSVKPSRAQPGDDDYLDGTPEEYMFDDDAEAKRVLIRNGYDIDKYRFYKNSEGKTKVEEVK